jgi:IS4 transposase
VTTLLDAEVYRVADLAELYHQRWQVETSLAR